MRVLGVRYRQIHLCGAGDLQKPPLKSPKPVDKMGSQLSPAIAWRLEFLATVPNILDKPGCGLWYRSEQKVWYREGRHGQFLHLSNLGVCAEDVVSW